MRINEASIDYNTVCAISDIVGNIYEYSDREENADNMRIAALGEISGVLKFAEIMKEVLQS